MLALAFFRWWYGPGWLTALRQLNKKLKGIYTEFSVPALLRTLFKPWRQIVTGRDPNAVVGQKLSGLVDNVVSRFIGFWVRVLTLLVGAFVMAVAALGLALVVLVWPALPLLVGWLAARGVGLL